MVDISALAMVYKPIHDWGAPPCREKQLVKAMKQWRKHGKSHGNIWESSRNINHIIGHSWDCGDKVLSIGLV